MRYGRELFDASKLDNPFGNRYLLTVDEGLLSKTPAYVFIFQVSIWDTIIGTDVSIRSLHDISKVSGARSHPLLNYSSLPLRIGLYSSNAQLWHCYKNEADGRIDTL